MVGMTTKRQQKRAQPAGAILLEVVFSLALLAAAAGVILGSMSSSIHAAERVRAEATLADVLVTVKSHIQMGLIPMDDVEAQAFDDPKLEGWTYTVKAAAVESSIDTGGAAAESVPAELKHVEVTVFAPNNGGLMRSATLMRVPTTGLNSITTGPIGGGL